MRIWVRIRGRATDPAELDVARAKLRVALGRYAASIAAAQVQVDTQESSARCRVRLRLVVGEPLCAEATAPTVAEAIDRAMQRGAAAVARAVDAARLLGG